MDVDGSDEDCIVTEEDEEMECGRSCDEEDYPALAPCQVNYLE